MSLDSVLYVGRSGVYATPKQTNDPLPIVYGDLTDGTTGVWKLPCIQVWNGATAVYCYAGHETLSAANGNTVTIYVDGVASGAVTFNEANNFETQGVISTITFTADPGNANITARGKGKPTVSGGATLMNNIVDIIQDALIVEAGAIIASDFQATAKAAARRTFTDQGYVAAGVIDKDEKLWTLLAQMMASFRGDAYLDADNKLVLSFDTGTPSTIVPATIIGSGDIKFDAARLQRQSLINRIPAVYAYNYVDNAFSQHTDDVALRDEVSVGIYGESTPEAPYEVWWSRNLASVQTVQGILVALYKDPGKLWEITFTDNTPKSMHIDIGDYIVASFDLLYGSDGNPMKNEFFRVLEISHDLNTDTTKIRALSTGTFLRSPITYGGGYTYGSGYIYGGTRDTTDY